MTPQALLLLLISSLIVARGQMLGGFKQREDHHNDPHIKEIATFAVQKLQAERNQKLELVKVVSCQTQVVAGMNYKFVLDAANEAQELHTFEVTIYEPLGGQEKKLTEHKLLPKGEANRTVEDASERAKPALLGAYKDVDPTSSEVKDAATYAAQQLSQQSNSLFPLKLEQVLKAKTKVAAGLVFDLELRLSQEKASDQTVQVEVQRSLGNEFSLHNSKTLQS